MVMASLYEGPAPCTARGYHRRMQGPALSKRPVNHPAWLPVAASVVLPGLGQWLQGRRAAALAFLIAALLAWIVWLGWLVHLGAAVDADRHVAR